MADITVFYRAGANGEPGGFDLSLARADLTSDDELGSAVLLSLFSDRRARPDDRYTGNPRGWWANADYGSRLWLLEREKQTPQVAERARQYASEALAWLTRQRIAERVDVTATWADMGVLALAVSVWKPGNIAARYSFLWQQQRV